MKQPSWETLPGALLAFLNTNTQAIPVDLYTITLQNGTVLRYSCAEIALTVNGQSYGIGPLLKRSRTRQVVGIEVDEMDLELFADAEVVVAGMSIISAIAFGIFSGATIRVESAFYDSSFTVVGTVPTFYGRVGQVVTGRGRAFVQVRSHSELLNVMIPGDVYQPGCKNTLYDLYCGANRNAFKFTQSVITGSGAAKTVFKVPQVAPGGVRVPEGRFNIGVVVFTSGPNAGTSRTIRSHVRNGSSERITMLTPTAYEVGTGDVAQLFYGCNKTQATCGSIFNNTINFRGEPYIPAPETIT